MSNIINLMGTLRASVSQGYTPRADMYSGTRLALGEYKRKQLSKLISVVTTEDGHQFKVRRISCGLPHCMCDEVILECVDAS